MLTIKKRNKAHDKVDLLYCIKSDVNWGVCLADAPNTPVIFKSSLDLLTTAIN